jgi:hypothetical protein
LEDYGDNGANTPDDGEDDQACGDCTNAPHRAKCVAEQHDDRQLDEYLGNNPENLIEPE